MLDDLVDPQPPEPTAEVREAVRRRARAILRRRQAAVVTGGLAAVALMVAGSVALFGGGDGDTDQVATNGAPTEVGGIQEVHPDATSTTTTPPPEPEGLGATTETLPGASPPSSAFLAGEVVVPAGFTITGCTMSGAPLALDGNEFLVLELSPGTSVEIVCDAASGDGAARAARVVVDLQPGPNAVLVDL